MSNAEVIAAWDGPTGEKWVADADRYDRLNQRFGHAVVAAVAAQAGERVVDIGCGNGALLLDLAPQVAPDGCVVGVDVSGPMLGAAMRRTDGAGLGNVSFVKADAQTHAFDPGGFDAAVSRFGVMFFADPVAAFANIGRALRSGGRLVFACWQEMIDNEWLMVPATAALAHVPFPELAGPDAPGPFSLADQTRVRSVLTEAGFVDIALDVLYEPMVLGQSVDDVVAFLLRTDVAALLFKNAPQAGIDAAVAAMAEVLAPHQSDEGVTMHGAAWLVQARMP
jgi:SAM-dependent methyltransferase